MLQKNFEVPNLPLTQLQEMSGDGYAILQTKENEKGTYMRYMRYEFLEKKGMLPTMDDYNIVYVGSLNEPTAANTEELLEKLFTMFNVDHPRDFVGHSLSVSDIVILKQQEHLAAYYCDNYGFLLLPQFLPKEVM